MKPTVSIVIPVYNAGKFLQECLDSIASQTYKDIGLIAVDDCSQDNSLKILHEFAKNKPWVKILHNETNLGVSPTFNRAIAQAKGKYIARMDADDVMESDRIRLQVDYLENHPDTVIVGGQCRLINEKGEVIGKKTFPLEHEAIKDMLFRTVPMQQPTIMINRSLLPTDFKWSNPDFAPAEDYGLFFAALQYGKFANLPETTLSYREHGTNISLVKPKFTFWRIWRARWDGLLHQHYVPSLKSALVVAAQTLAILVIPEKYVYPLHTKLRGMK